MKKSIFHRAPKFLQTVALTLAFLSVAGSAQAELVIENEATPPPVVSRSTATIENVGSPVAATLVRQDIVKTDFTKALKQVVPAGWKGFADASSGVTKVGKISVKAAKRPWIDVLDEMLSQNGFSATVNWDRKEITFKPKA